MKNKNKNKNIKTLKPNKKLSKKFWITTAGTLAGLVAISVGAGVACVPDKVKNHDPKAGLEIGENSQFNAEVKKNFLAGVMADSREGLTASNVDLVINTHLMNKNINLQVRNADLAIRMPATGSTYVNANVPFVLNGTNVFNLKTTLVDGELYFAIDGFDKNDEKTSIKYNIHVGKDESTRQIHVDGNGIQTSTYAETEFEKFLSAVKQCFNAATEESEEEDLGLLANLHIDFEKILDAVWDIKVTRNVNGPGYVGFLNLPIQLKDQATPLASIPMRLDFSNQYHLRSIIAPLSDTEDVQDYINIDPKLTSPLTDTGVKFSMSVNNEKVEPKEPANKAEYTPMTDSLKLIKEIAKITNSKSFDINLDLDVEHQVDAETTEHAKVTANTGVMFAKPFNQLVSSGLNLSPEFINGALKLHLDTVDEAGYKHTYEQIIDGTFKDDAIYVNYNNASKVKLSKATLDKLIPAQKDEIAGSNATIEQKLNNVASKLQSFKDKKIVAGVLNAISDVKEIGTSKVATAIKDGRYGDLKQIIDTINLNDDKLIITIDLAAISLGGKISVVVAENEDIVINFDNVDAFGFKLNGNLGIEDNEEITMNEVNEEEYYEIVHLPGVIEQFTNLSLDKKISATINASVINNNGTFDNIEDNGGIVGKIDTTLDGTTKQGTVDANIQWYQPDAHEVTGLETTNPRRHDFDIKADITDHNDIYNKETNEFERTEFGSTIFMSFEDYEHDLETDMPLENYTDPFKARTGLSSINDLINLGKKVVNSNDVGITSLLSMFKKNETTSVISSIINNHLNNLIKYPVITDSNFVQNQVNADDSYTLSLNKDLVGLDNNIDVTATFGESCLKQLSVSTNALTNKNIKLDITLNEYKPVEETWNFSKKIDVIEKVEESVDETVEQKLKALSEENATDTENEPEMELDTDYVTKTVTKGDHNLADFVDISSMSMLLDCGLSTALFGSETEYVEDEFGNLIEVENNGEKTYHVRLITDKISVMSIVVNNLILDFNVKIAADGIYVLGTINVPILGYGAPTAAHEALYNNPIERQESGWIGKTNYNYKGRADDRHISTQFAYDSNAVDENGDIINGGAIYMHRNADYSKYGFKDARRVKFNDFKSNIKDWGLKYIVNSYLNISEEGAAYEPYQMKYVTSFLGGYSYSKDANEHTLRISNLSSINSMLANTGTVKIKGHKKTNVLTGVHIVVIVKIDYHIDLKVLNVSEDGRHIHSWTEDVQTSFDELKELVSPLAFSTTPYVVDSGLTVAPNYSVYNAATCERITTRDGFVQTLDGELISYDKFISSITPEVEAE